jgi:hypothetical protein
VMVSIALAVLSLIFPPAWANTVISTCSCKAPKIICFVSSFVHRDTDSLVIWLITNAET